MKKRMYALAALTVIASMMVGCGASSSKSTEAATESTESVAEVTESTEADTESVDESATEVSDDEEWSEVTALGLDADTMLAIYNDYETAWETSPDATHEGEYTVEDIEAEDAYEAQVSQDIGDKYGISADAADQVYFYVIANYDNLMADKGADTANIQLNYNDLLDVTTTGGRIVIKAKVSPNMTVELMRNGCFFDVYEAIQEYGLEQYDEIQYWAVADMTDGSEQKVISYTVTKDVMEKVADGSIVENKLIDNATDVWLAPAMQD